MILVTGANGFVGSHTLERLLRDKRFAVIAGVRSRCIAPSSPVERRAYGDLADLDDRHLFHGVSTVVHTAARVHVMTDGADDPLYEYRKVNVTGTMSLALRAAESGVRRFVFLSSVKVNGEETAHGSDFSANDTPSPVDPYGVSKMEAEAALFALAEKSGMEVVVIRPPLVYGPGVRANFQALINLVRRGFPLPLGAIDNERSLVAVGNLVDLIATCIEHPKAANKVFMVSDGHDLSTPELVRRLAHAMSVRARLVDVPVPLLRVGASLVGRRDLMNRLCGSLKVNIDATRTTLGWNPPVAVDAAMRGTVESLSSEARL